MQRLLVLTAAALAGAGTAHAGLLGVATEEYPAIVDDIAAVYWDPDDLDLNVTGYGRSQLVSGRGVLLEDLYFQIDIDVAAGGGLGPAGGSARISDLDALEVTGTVTGFASAITDAEVDAMEFLIDLDESPTEVLARITGYFGEVPIEDSEENFFLANGVRIAEVAPVPLPAGGLLLLAALGGLALRARS